MARKKTARTAATYKSSVNTRQTGQSKEQNDNYRKAKPPGWRKSARGNWYYEARKNRSDNQSQYDAHREDVKKRNAAKKEALKAARRAREAAARARREAQKANAAAKRATAKKSRKTTGKKRTTQKKLF